MDGVPLSAVYLCLDLRSGSKDILLLAVIVTSLVFSTSALGRSIYSFLWPAAPTTIAITCDPPPPDPLETDAKWLEEMLESHTTLCAYAAEIPGDDIHRAPRILEGIEL
jgi:hypothetical protein